MVDLARNPWTKSNLRASAMISKIRLQSKKVIYHYSYFYNNYFHNILITPSLFNYKSYFEIPPKLFSKVTTKEFIKLKFLIVHIIRCRRVTEMPSLRSSPATDEHWWSEERIAEECLMGVCVRVRVCVLCSVRRNIVFITLVKLDLPLLLTPHASPFLCNRIQHQDTHATPLCRSWKELNVFALIFHNILKCTT